MTSSRQGIDLIGPAPVDTSWQARRQTGFDVASFDIDWDAQVVICPEGKRSCTWHESTSQTRSAIRVSFARQRQQTPEFRTEYRRRAGIEGTISQDVRSCDARYSRYIGLAKTHLQQIAAAVALNFARLADWFLPLSRPKTTRLSHFAHLAPTCS